MSWTKELEKVYEILSCDNDNDMIPLYHSTANAQIELSISIDGEFKGASCVSKEDAVTTIPVTEDSGSRSSGISPMPFADKLVYIAGDYSKYANGKNADNYEYYSAYMNQLKEWRDSSYSHGYVDAVYKYLEKCELMNDLEKSGILKTDPDSGRLLENEKIAGIDQADSFVRFIVSGDKTWKQRSFYNSFISYVNSKDHKKQLCYASGDKLVPTYKHPSKIRNSGDKAKIISSNDESGFTYRGRFNNKEEAVSISYEFSQKIHNALKWLIKNHSISIQSLSLVVWAETLEQVPDIVSSPGFEEFPDDENEQLRKNLDVDFEESLRKYLFGHRQKFQSNTKVMIMGLDSATTGRMNISLYSEIESTRFYENVAKWHRDTSWLCFNGKMKRNEICSFNIKNIADRAYGTEQGKFIDCGDMLKGITMRLVPCIAEGKKISRDIVDALFRKASNPLAYSEHYNHRAVLETACGMIKKFYIDHKNMEGEKLMSYDPNNNDRSYLFGCLLAVADKLEKSTFDTEKDAKRETNARRYWSAFVSRPAQMWQKIEESLLPYKPKLSLNTRNYYERCINEIMDKFTDEAFSDSRGLEPIYLLGYHHYTVKMSTYSKKNEEEE